MYSNVGPDVVLNLVWYARVAYQPLKRARNVDCSRGNLERGFAFHT